MRALPSVVVAVTLASPLLAEDWPAFRGPSGFEEPTIRAVRLGGRGDVTKTHIFWEQKRGVPMLPSFVYAKGGSGSAASTPPPLFLRTDTTLYSVGPRP